jgi:hypothetical protein
MVHRNGVPATLKLFKKRGQAGLEEALEIARRARSPYTTERSENLLKALKEG